MSERCIDYDTCPGSKPQYVGRSIPRYAQSGYAPAYCGYCPNYKPDTIDYSIKLRLSELEMTQYEPGSIPQWYHDRTQQLEGRVLHAEAKLQEHIAASKKKAQLKVPRKGLKEIEA